MTNLLFYEAHGSPVLSNCLHELSRFFIWREKLQSDTGAVANNEKCNRKVLDTHMGTVSIGWVAALEHISRSRSEAALDDRWAPNSDISGG